MEQVIPAGTKFAFTTRRIDRSEICNIKEDYSRARSGDLVLAEIVRIGSHRRVQLPSGRNSELHVGDHVVLCCGSRYAPDQFEGIAELTQELSDMLAAGGIIGRMTAKHEAIKDPTQLRPIGLLADAAGRTINIERYALPRIPYGRRVPVIAVTGAAMNSGKTTAAFSLVHGLRAGGFTVAAIKVTGTGAFGDLNAFKDAGASMVSDFTDAGMASTYQQPVAGIIDAAESLLAHAVDGGAEVIVVELGDGVLQNEAAGVLRHPSARQWIHGIIFAAPDALSGISGVDFLKRSGLPVVGVSGLLTRSPLLCSEFRGHESLPLFDKASLSSADTAFGLVGDLLGLGAVA